MTITGTIDEVQDLFAECSELLKQTISVPDSISINISLYSQNRQLIILDRETLQEASAVSLKQAQEAENFYIIEKEIYDRLLNCSLTDYASPNEMGSQNGISSAILSEPSFKPSQRAIFAPKASQMIEYTSDERNAVKKAKTKNALPKTDPTISLSAIGAGERSRFTTLNEYYCIEDLLEDSVRSEKKCAFAIKYLDENYFFLYYRSSIYDKGSDTTFRHYLLKQPGELIAYRYFKYLSSLRQLFKDNGLKLRHNGNNILSRSQADEIVRYFTRCC